MSATKAGEKEFKAGHSTCSKNNLWKIYQGVTVTPKAVLSAEDANSSHGNDFKHHNRNSVQNKYLQTTKITFSQVTA